MKLKVSKWKLWLIPLVLILGFGLVKGGSMGKKTDSPKPPEVQVVATAAATKIKKDNVIKLTGSIEAHEDASVSSKLSGRVSQIYVDNGRSVSAGQPLVSLESQDYSNNLALSRTNLEKAKINYQNALANYQRFSELHKAGAISDKDFEDMELKLKLAQVDVNTSEISVSTAQESLRNATISSPISGVVANKKVTPGQFLQPGSALMSIVDASSVYVVVNVEQEKLIDVKPGLNADITINGYPGKKFQGLVEYINPVAVEGARTFETKIKINNSEGILKPGMFAAVEIKTGEAVEALTIPQSALSGKQGVYYVYVPEGDHVKKRKVEIGQIFDQLVEIKSGITDGQQVVTTNVNKLMDQDKIKVTK